jgi:hypothetical protein
MYTDVISQLEQNGMCPESNHRYLSPPTRYPRKIPFCALRCRQQTAPYQDLTPLAPHTFPRLISNKKNGPVMTTGESCTSAYRTAPRL